MLCEYGPQSVAISGKDQLHFLTQNYSPMVSHILQLKLASPFRVGGAQISSFGNDHEYSSQIYLRNSVNIHFATC